jgi:hypothetical protein
MNLIFWFAVIANKILIHLKFIFNVRALNEYGHYCLNTVIVEPIRIEPIL